MNLNPPSYAGQDHGQDLTSLVAEALEDVGPPVAFPGRIGRRGPRPFEVIVACPGTGPNTAHKLAFTGQYSP